MKNWYVGVDGGGTKTEFAVSASDGIPVATLRKQGCSYQSIGVEKATSLVITGVTEILSMVNADKEDCAGLCVGMPCSGENAEKDTVIMETLSSSLAPIPIHIVNDVEVGWAGALECHEGIHIVAGTGSIAFGCGRDNKTARCGGWSEFFGDEGSCYWIGREAMSLFTKEADGRLPKGALYDLVCKEFSLTGDYRFVDTVINELAPYRDRVAHFQVYARQAAEAGDQAVLALYTAAAQELALMVGALKEKLNFTPGTVDVSYTGGLFKAGDLILQPLRKMISLLDGKLQEPRHKAVDGALILAIEKFQS